MNYPDSVRYLYALGNELKAGAKLGLERMEILLAGMGNPERGQRFIHVAGTNGKGSTSAMIAAVLQRAGYRTGLYTSPHLVSPTERIQINEVAVSESQFEAAFERVHAVAEELMARDAMDAHPSYFETVTAMALLLFREQACDVSVIEVGLGGRLDATNVIQPELCVITPVSFDHEAYLGDTIEAIAGEKAGIIKAGVTVVLAEQPAAADAVMLSKGEKVFRSRVVELKDLEVNAEFSSFQVDGVAFVCPLAGRHQLENARTAIAACRVMSIEDGIIAQGMQETRWPGRMETVLRSPRFILDGAHNPAGAAVLAGHIREFYSGRPVWIVFAGMRDKAIDEVVSPLFPLADRLILTAPEVPRALRPEAILKMHPHPKAVCTATVKDALEVAQTAPKEATVFFTGSLFLVGEVKGLLALS